VVTIARDAGLSRRPQAWVSVGVGSGEVVDMVSSPLMRVNLSVSIGIDVTFAEGGRLAASSVWRRSSGRRRISTRRYNARRTTSTLVNRSFLASDRHRAEVIEMSGPVEIVLILAAVGYLLARRVIGEPAQAKRMLILPVVLSLIGLSGQVKTPLSLLFLVATAAIGVLLGALRGVSVRVSQREGLAFLRYTGVTVVLWVVNLAIKFGAIDPKDAAAVGNSLLLTFGLGILAEGLVVLYRALRNDHRVMWAQGQDGSPHRMSPFLDNLRRGMTNRADNPYDNYQVSGWKTRPDQLRDYRR
jgi:hypothetical protein